MVHMAKKATKTGTVTNEKIFGLLLDMDERMATKADLRDYSTKNDLERVKDEILDIIKPIGRAVDKDAETIFNHGKRIVVLERKAGVVVK